MSQHTLQYLCMGITHHTYDLSLGACIWIYTRLGRSYRPGVETGCRDGLPTSAQPPDNTAAIM